MSSPSTAHGAVSAPHPPAAVNSRAADAFARVRAMPRELAALLAVAAILALGWAIALPPFQGPDEITHVNYVQQLAETGETPRYDEGQKSVSTEMAAALEILQLRSIVGIDSARPAFTGVEEDLWRQTEGQIGKAGRSDGIGPSPLARNPQLYYGVEALPYLAFGGADLLDRLIAMRLVNALLFVLTVGLTWLLASELFGRERRFEVVVATGVVALWPMLGFMGGVVNPDTALTTAYTLVDVARGAAPATRPVARAGADALPRGRGVHARPRPRGAGARPSSRRR